LDHFLLRDREDDDEDEDFGSRFFRWREVPSAPGCHVMAMKMESRYLSERSEKKGYVSILIAKLKGLLIYQNLNRT